MAEDPRSGGRVRTSLFEAAQTIKDALPFALSIDNYLDAQREDSDIVAIGKIAIARAILEAEKHSSLAPRPTSANLRLQGRRPFSFPKKVEQSWHLRLVQLLTAGKPVGEISTVFDDTAFIVFNYDRCLEHFLIGALKTYYHVNDDIINEAMRNLKVIHPYGKVGALPWQRAPVKVSYGGLAGPKLLDIAEGIRTFTESVESGVVKDVKRTMRDARTIVFMGFGFLPQNVNLLTTTRRSEASRVFFTSKGISDNDVDIVEDEISTMLRKKEEGEVTPSLNLKGEFEDEEPSWSKFPERGTCLDLMNNNWLRLTRR